MPGAPGVRLAYRWLFRRLPGQHEAGLASLSGLIHGEPVLLVGPPGTGKTLLITSLARMVNAKAYIIQLHKYMTDVEVFGPYNVRALQDGRLVRNWSPIISADVIYLDEVFNAPSFLLNALNSMLNERLIYDPFTGEVMPIRAFAIYGASNYIPQSPELMAFADRFPIKASVDYVSPEFYGEALRVSNDSQETPSGIITPQELGELRTRALEILGSDGFTDEYLLITQGIAGLREFGVKISDRTLFTKLPRVIASLMALLDCPAEQKGCTTYTAFLVMPWVIGSSLQLPEEYRASPEDSVRESLKMARNDFMALVSAVRVFMRYEAKVLAMEPMDLAGYENTINDIADVLRYQRWYSFLVDFLEWRVSWLSKRAEENAGRLARARS
ncbi:AAA family ATPase [Vulcanisaeta souniana]|nr:AAA family ATPase [Vulcanisaeta souniana]BDR92259.1 hypothetical protein Vsou_13520 [Vulcanisaeta souniana JCM 11219]